MSSPNPPPEDPEYTSELKVLSPVSPKPLHYPLPQNIPILEKQIDQAFNQTSAHMDAASLQPATQALDQNVSTNPQASSTNAASTAPLPDDSQPQPPIELGQDATGQTQTAQRDNQMNHALPYTALAANDAAPVPNDQASVQASHEPIPTPSEHSAVAPTPTPTHANVTAQSPVDLQSIPPPAQAQGVTLEAHSAGVDDNVNHVQFQSSLQDLLANFSQTNPSIADQPPAFPLSSAAAQQAPGTASGAIAAATSGPPPGLPPKPPAQEQPSIHPNYESSTDIRAYHPHSQHASPPTYPQQGAGYDASAQQPAFPPAPGQTAAPAINSLPPPPVASFQQQSMLQQYTESATSRANRQRELESQREIKLAAGEVLDEADVPWTPETQRKYDVFLNEERKYVTEGNWEQFPHGSRLFVGNLSSERVTKRDIFHVFHRYGDLAQISIKQAYGFVQYLQPDACARAMQVEQGNIIRGKKIHLEVSKPQKNRNTDTKGSRRSRSPERGGRGGGGGNTNTDRYLPSPQERRDRGDNRSRKSGRGGGRDDYRRSPSPSYGRYRRNSRDRSRDRYDGRYRSRSRSPYSRNNSSRYRSPSPRRSEDDDLPLPRRRADSIPDIQIIVLDPLDRDFITYIERAFSSRSLRVDVLFLSPRLNLDAVVKRQVLEGVHAVSQLRMENQTTVKISLQLYDRRNPSNVRFDEYRDLDLNVAAELVIRAKAQNQPPAPLPPSVPLSYGYPGIPPPLPPQISHLPPQITPLPVTSTQQQPNLGNLITSLDPTGLQKLLGAMQQSPHGHPLPPSLPRASAPGGHLSPELAKLLSGAGAGGLPPPPLPPPHSMPGGYQAPYGHQQGGGAVDPFAALRANPALAGLLGQMQGTPQQPQAIHQQQQPHMQNGGTAANGAVNPPQAGGHDMAEILARLGTYGQR